MGKQLKQSKQLTKPQTKIQERKKLQFNIKARHMKAKMLRTATRASNTSKVQNGSTIGDGQLGYVSDLCDNKINLHFADTTEMMFEVPPPSKPGQITFIYVALFNINYFESASHR